MLFPKPKKLFRGFVLCLLLVFLGATYIILKEKELPWSGRQSQMTHSLADLFSSTDQKKQADKWKSLYVTTKDNHLPAYVNVVDLQSASTKKTTGNGSVSSDCRLTTTNPVFRVCLFPKEQDKSISGTLMTRGAWESRLTRLFLLALRRFPRATVIDAGANIGYYSLMAAAMGHPVIAVEPALATMEKLAQGVQANGAADRVYVLHNALAESHRNVSLKANSVNQGRVSVQEEVVDNHAVQTIIMDDLLHLIHTHNVIIKMDIEGYECLAMAASRKLFRDVNVVYMFIEWKRMFLSRENKTAACPAMAIQEMTDSFVRLGYLAHDAKTNRAMNPINSSSWTVHDVYWRHRDQLPLP